MAKLSPNKGVYWISDQFDTEDEDDAAPENTSEGQLGEGGY